MFAKALWAFYGCKGHKTIIVGGWGRKDGNNGLRIRNWRTKYVGGCVNQYTFGWGLRRQSLNVSSSWSWLHLTNDAPAAYVVYFWQTIYRDHVGSCSFL